MTIRGYNHETDFASFQRMWGEIGWATTPEDQAAIEWLVTDADIVVGDIDGEVEAMASVHEGSIRYVDRDLKLAAVTAVTTSMIGRKRGFATDTTARVVANAKSQGHHVAALGMFEQGFYDRLGFGTGAYTARFVFDPSSLQLDVPYRTPKRLGVDDWEIIHDAHAGRLRAHGGVRLDSSQMTRFELAVAKEPLSWGYFDGDRLTHGIWAKRVDYDGPLSVFTIWYETPEQLLELLASIRELGDQFRSVRIIEPPELQLQDLLRHPIRQRIQTSKSPHEARMGVFAWWQLRILDLEHVVQQRSWSGEAIEFNLRLSDPLEDYVPGVGIGGEYRVTISQDSHVVFGMDASLPTLDASINAFSRMWFGVRPASSLALTDSLRGPASLLSRLDQAFRLPAPIPGMFF